MSWGRMTGTGSWRRSRSSRTNTPTAIDELLKKKEEEVMSI